MTLIKCSIGFAIGSFFTYLFIIKNILGINFFHLKMKLRACSIIFFGHKHWFFISIDSHNLRKLIDEKNCESELFYHALAKYNVKRICKKIVEDMTEVDWILEKAQFEADAEDFLNRKKMTKK